MEVLLDSDPRNIGPYQVLGRIGTGGMGVVYLAENAAGKRVALKLVRPELIDDPSFLARFRREVEAGQRVGGICTAKYLDADLESTHPYLVTEYIEGGSLADYVADNGPMAGDELIGLAVGLAEAVVAIHAAGVIHRDLKPSNVLLAPGGPKVVDFGISHATDGTALTQTGIVLGSPSWMAPEQAVGRQITPAIDVFSWGATVAFAATGRSPFGEGRSDAVLYRVVHESPDLEGLDPRLQGPVAQALQKDPAKRPPADRLLVDLVKTAMSGTLPPGGSVAMTTLVLDRTWGHEAPTPVEPKRGHRTGWLIAGAAAIVLVASAAGGVLLASRHSSNQTASVSATTGTRASSPGGATTTSGPASSPSTATQSPTALVAASLPVVTCPTSYGITPSPAAVALPSTMTVSVPNDLAKQLAVYSDEQGTMKLLGPRDWACDGNYGADGSGGVSVYPTGEQVPSGQPFTASSDQAIVGSQAGGCAGCAITQASPLFTSAANDCANNFLGSCGTRPEAESVETIGNGVVGFLDPPNVAGDGNPSGGQYPANGVMTYHGGSTDSSWLDTCTLPYSQQALCTAVLNTFVDWYGAS